MYYVLYMIESKEYVHIFTYAFKLFNDLCGKYHRANNITNSQ